MSDFAWMCLAFIVGIIMVYLPDVIAAWRKK